MNLTFEIGSLEWHEMKRDLARLAFERAMERFDVHAANTACALQDYHKREIENLKNEN